MNLAQIVALHGRYRADHPAMEDGARVITYADLDLMVRRIAGRLKAHGVVAGDLVGLQLRDRPEHVAAMLAVAWCGATSLPFDWRWRPAEVARAITRFFPRLLVAEAAVVGAVPVMTLDDLDSASADGTPPAAVEDAPFIYSLSSGTTGEPKAAVITHEATIARGVVNGIELPIPRDDRFLMSSPIAYGAGRQQALSRLMLGTTLVFFPTLFEPEELVAVVASRHIHTVMAVPVVTRALLRLPSPAAGPLLRGVRLFMSSGASIQIEEKQAIRAKLAPLLVDVFASIGGGLISYSHNRDQDLAPASVGRPALGVEVEIVDDGGRPLPVGDNGWLRVRGPGMARELIGAVAGSDERIENGWSYSGDKGRLDAAGFLYLEGRSSEIIKRGGTTIHAAEVERALAQHAAVVEAAVVGVPDRDLGEIVAAFVVLGAPATAPELVIHCRRLLAPHKIPQQIVMLDSLPRNASGKVVKAALLERLGGAEPSAGPGRP